MSLVLPVVYRTAHSPLCDPGPSSSVQDGPLPLCEPGPSSSVQDGPLPLCEPGPSSSVQDGPLPLCEPGPSSSVQDGLERDSFDILGEFVEGWIAILDRDDKKSLAMLLCYALVKEFSFTETRAAVFTAKIINKSEKSVRLWCTDLITNNGTFSKSK